MVLIGATFLFLSFSPAMKIWRNLSGRVRRKWLIIIYLMGFFILGYLAFAVILISNLPLPLELVPGGVFLGGAVFVYVIINISLNTVAAQQKAEEAILVAKNDWENTFDAVTDMITIHDMDFNIIRANPAARAIFGLQPHEEIPLVKCFRCYHGTGKPPSGCASCQSLQTEKPSTIEMFEPYLNKHLEIRAMPRFGNDRRLVGLIHVVRDITERKLAEEELKHTLDSLRKAVGATLQVMESVVETRDLYTSGHQNRTADIARAIAVEMGLPNEKIDAIRMAGSIHDIGKLFIPSEILSKPSKLSEIEFSLIKEHARKGYEILKNVESPWPLAEIVYQHHERMNGSGYPRNLKGDDILIEARIMAVADVVESMSSYRPYRPALGIDTALKEIEKNKGTLYDKNVADACLRLFREKSFQLKKKVTSICVRIILTPLNSYESFLSLSV